ncbi:MAG: TA system VapC family ribonuclease toxin [Candidatus Sulfotelmatobacter sp.]
MIRRNLLDLNVLIALADPEHIHRQKAERWFLSTGKNDWGVCPLTEAGFIRIATNPAMRPATIPLQRAIAILHALRMHPGYRYWPITDTESWVAVTARFASRISGHQQVTDAYLLGMAIKEDGVLVTFDRGLKYLAGPEFSRNILVLE